MRTADFVVSYGDIPTRFLANVTRTETCWLWGGMTSRSGYGIFHGRPAHRASYELHKGPIPDGLLIRHTCDTPPCVNPDHLLVGTPADNARDMKERARYGLAKSQLTRMFRRSREDEVRLATLPPFRVPEELGNALMEFQARQGPGWSVDALLSYLLAEALGVEMPGIERAREAQQATRA